MKTKDKNKKVQDNGKKNREEKKEKNLNIVENSI